MTLAVDAREVCYRAVGVKLRAADACVAQQFLNVPEVGTTV